MISTNNLHNNSLETNMNNNNSELNIPFVYEDKIELNNKECILRTRVKHLKLVKINKWDGNRKPDNHRIESIKDAYKHADIMDGMIYLFIRNKNIYCYDGLHRISSISEVNDECIIIIHYMINPTEFKVETKFKLVNLAVPVPTIYTEENRNSEKTKTLEDVQQYYYDRYSEFFTHSKNPRVPNTNKHIMIDKLNDIIKRDSEKETWVLENWTSYLNSLNNKIKEKVLNRYNKNYKLSDKQKEKCSNHDFFLFATKNWQDEIVL